MLRNTLLLCIVGLLASSAAQEFGARIGKRVGRIGQSNGYFYPVPQPPFTLPVAEVITTSRPAPTTARPVTFPTFPTFPTVSPCQVDPNCVGPSCRPVGPNCGPAPTVPIRTTPRPAATTAYTTPRPAATTAYTTPRPAPTTTRPAPTTTRPAPTTTRPAPTTTRPAPTTTRPAPTTVAYTTARPTLGPCQVDPFCVGPNCGPVGPNCKQTTPVPVRTTTRPAPTTTRPAPTTTRPAPTTPRPATTARPTTTTVSLDYLPPVEVTTTRRPATIGPCQVDPNCVGPSCRPLGPNCGPAPTVPIRTTPRPVATTAYTTPRPAPTTTRPAPTTTRPAPTTTRPAPTTTRPAPTTTRPAPTTVAYTTARPTVGCQVDPFCVGPNCGPVGPNCKPTTTVPVRTTTRPAPTTTRPAPTTTRPAPTTTRPATVPVRTTTAKATTPALDYLPPVVVTTKAPARPTTTQGYDYPAPENPLDFGPSNNQGTGLKFPTTAKPVVTTPRPAPTTTKPAPRPTTTTRRPNVQPVLTASEEEILFWDFRESIAGEPELDYPIFDKIPVTSFSCEGKIKGYYADEEARCQVFHVCSEGADDSVLQSSFLCPNGTIFSQESFACLWWHDVECASSGQFTNLNANIGVVPESAGKASAGAASSGSGIQISASAGASSSSSGGRGISASASASSSTFAAGNKQAHAQAGSSHSNAY